MLKTSKNKRYDRNEAALNTRSSYKAFVFAVIDLRGWSLGDVYPYPLASRVCETCFR